MQRRLGPGPGDGESDGLDTAVGGTYGIIRGRGGSCEREGQGGGAQRGLALCAAAKGGTLAGLCYRLGACPFAVGVAVREGAGGGEAEEFCWRHGTAVSECRSRQGGGEAAARCDQFLFSWSSDSCRSPADAEKWTITPYS